MKNLYTLLFITFATLNISIAQSTWDSVYTLLNSSCDGSGCHQQDNTNISFKVDTPANFLYTQLVNADPLNPWARDTIGNKLVDPCNTNNSFLIRKLSCGTGSEPALKDPEEGDCMPQDLPMLDAAEIQLVRRWIAGCASDTGVAVGVEDLLATQSLKVYPNPFSNHLVVRYSLMRASKVQIELFDSKGVNLIAAIPKTQPAGEYGYDVLNGEGFIPPGMYMLRMIIGNETITKRVTKLN